MRSFDLATQSNWPVAAACHEADPGLFFPRPHESVVPALRVCATCPVRTPCLDHALEIGDTSGIRGGLTPAVRQMRIRDGA